MASATVPPCFGPSSSLSPRSRSPDPPPRSRRWTGCRRWTTASRSPSPATRPTGRAAGGGPACSSCTGSRATAARSTRSRRRSRTPATRCSPTTRAATAPRAARSRSPGPREVADLRALRNAFAARPEVSDTIGAWGISYGGGQIWNALAAGVPFAAAEVVETWTSLYEALWPQNLARSGIVAGFAASIAARSPLVAGIRDDAVQSPNLGAVRLVRRSGPPRAGSIRTPVYLFQGKSTSRSTSPRRRRRSPGSAARRSSTPATSATRPRRSPGSTAATSSRRASPGSTATSRGRGTESTRRKVVIAKRASGSTRSS